MQVCTRHVQQLRMQSRPMKLLPSVRLLHNSNSWLVFVLMTLASSKVACHGVDDDQQTMDPMSAAAFEEGTSWTGRQTGLHFIPHECQSNSNVDCCPFSGLSFKQLDALTCCSDDVCFS